MITESNAAESGGVILFDARPAGQRAATTDSQGAARTMAKKKKNPVEVYQMVCESCKERNYVTSLKRENKSLEVKKYCPSERKHTMHKAKKA